MKRIFAAAIMMAFAVTASAQFHYGLRAGYALNTKSLGVKDVSLSVNPGINHGFYVGPQVEYYILPNLAVSGQILFQKSGGHFNSSPEKVYINAQQMMKDLDEMQDKYSGEVDHAFKPLSTKGLIGPEDEEGPGGIGEILQTIVSVNNAKGDISQYDMSVPLSIKFTSGKLGVIAGVNLNYTIFSNISFSATMNAMGGGETYSSKDIIDDIDFKKGIAETYMDLYGPDSVKKTDEDGDPTMSLNEFYTKAIAQRFTVGAHVGLEYMFTKNFGIQAIYSRSLMNNVRKPWNDMIKASGQIIQIGMVFNIQ
ncbi:MAG: outer membrane beta-barrel protein [Bacteroidales bacterium]|nr:outer membrane beta-barrel protein [Bacteroidales bacterium]